MAADTAARKAIGAAPAEAETGDARIPYDLIELFFFAYRDFVGDPDRRLAEIGFGRAHHRVLHFVDRNPGLTIAELLDILKITKQSLNRVLKELVEQGHVEAKAGRADRRQRHLATTARGKALARELAEAQAARIGPAVAALPAGGRTVIETYLTQMIDPDERRGVLARIRKGPVA